MKREEDYMSFLVSGVIGVRDDIERLLLTKGMSPIKVDEIINKVEIIIALSGELGRTLQRDKDLEELGQIKAELRMYKKGVI